jgi:hypothetical protein
MAERVRRLRADFAVRSRAASGIDPAGITTGLPGVWLSLAVERVQSPTYGAEVTIRQRAKRGPKLSGGASHHESRGGAPRGERAPPSTLRHPMMPPTEGAPVGALLPSLLFRGFWFFVP